MISKITSFFYKTSQLRKKYGKGYNILPSKVIFTDKDVKDIKSLNWFFSKRLNLIVSKDKILLGSNVILKDNIMGIECYKLKSNIFLFTYSAFKIKVSNGNFIYIGIDKYDDKLNDLLNIHKTYQYIEKKTIFSPIFLCILSVILYLFSYFMF